MVAAIVLMTALTATGGPVPHVRSSVPRIAALLTRGVECSSTVRHLVAALDASDVIVYIEAKQRRPSLSFDPASCSWVNPTRTGMIAFRSWWAGSTSRITSGD